MKKSELIKLLQAIPEDLEIVVNGYEGGYQSIDTRSIEKLCMSMYEGDRCYIGEHREAEFWALKYDEETKIFQNVILIGRN